jgi:UDP-N-acetylmuramoylalanine-D-glutamate ligase
VSLKASTGFLPALWIGKLTAAVVGCVSPSRGTNLSGKVAYRLHERLLDGFRGIDPDKTILITGSNGKSTSNNLVVHVLRTAGFRVATNLEGANLKTGIATTLIKNSTLAGKLRADYLVLEVDERSLPAVQASLGARFLAVTNIQKDQVQRNGDPDYIYRKILMAVDRGMTLFVNNEEPRSAALAGAGGRAIRFSVAELPTPGTREWDEPVTMACPRCHDQLEFAYYNLAGVGRFACPACGFSSADKPDYVIDSVDRTGKTFTTGGRTYHLAYDAPYFLYDYALACAVGTEFGLTGDDLERAFATFTNVGGRVEEFPAGGTRIRYLRMKQENPETLQSVLDQIAADDREKILLLGLQLVQDFVPFYSNVAYAYDCDFSRLAAPAARVEAAICFGRVNCYDAAVRLQYAGFPADKIILVDTDDPAPVLAAVGRCHAEQAYLVTMIGEYEALRREAERGEA